jgi:cytochrome c
VKRKLLLVSILAALPLFSCDRLPESSLAEVAQLTSGGNAKFGRIEIRKYGCNTCHTIPGVPGARGLIGPSLEQIGSRYSIAGNLSNTPENLMLWIMHPRQVDPHSLMPEMGVTESDSRDIAAYLYTLK